MGDAVDFGKCACDEHSSKRAALKAGCSWIYKLPAESPYLMDNGFAKFNADLSSGSRFGRQAGGYYYQTTLILGDGCCDKPRLNYDGKLRCKTGLSHVHFARDAEERLVEPKLYDGKLGLSVEYGDRFGVRITALLQVQPDLQVDDYITHINGESVGTTVHKQQMELGDACTKTDGIKLTVRHGTPKWQNHQFEPCFLKIELGQVAILNMHSGQIHVSEPERTTAAAQQAFSNEFVWSSHQDHDIARITRFRQTNGYRRRLPATTTPFRSLCQKLWNSKM